MYYLIGWTIINSLIIEDDFAIPQQFQLVILCCLE